MPSDPPAGPRAQAGPRLPAEWEAHERTVMGWPTSTRVDALWHDELEAARTVHATVASAIARFEPVTMVANGDDVGDASRRCGDGVDVVSLPIDDSWLRDTGAICVRDPDGTRRAVHFGFNAWGEAFAPFDRDQRVGAEVAKRLGLEVEDATSFVFEGGSIAADGTGLALTTERCLLNPNRNPGMGRDDIEATLADRLGLDRIVWLADGLAEDDGTDGHVDNVAGFFAPGSVLVQGCADASNPNHALALDRRARLDRAGISVVELADLPYATVAGASVPVPYGNFYVCNGAVIVPTVDGGEARWLDLIGDCFPDRDVVAVPGEVLAYGGGGVHCITQQVISITQQVISGSEQHVTGRPA
jgi:agmatine deiminase